MKKVVLLLSFLVVVVVAQVELKGIVIGEKVSPEVKATYSADVEGMYYKQSTLAGIEGIMIIQVLKDGVVFGVGFVFNDRITESELTKIKNGLQKKYSIEFDTEEEKYTGDKKLIKRGEVYTYAILLKENRYYGKPYEATVAVQSVSLALVNTEEEQEIANEDF